MSPYAEFLLGLCMAPGAVAAPTPSGATLARTIADRVDPSRPGKVVELGPGTGVITKALLDCGIPPDRILTVECCEYFVELLQREFPAVSTHLGDAFHFDRYLDASTPVCAVLSEIPLLNFEPVSRKVLIQKALRHSGHFIQLSYGWTPPVAPWTGVALERTLVWQNLPPARIWHYRTEHGSADVS